MFLCAGIPDAEGLQLCGVPQRLRTPAIFELQIDMIGADHINGGEASRRERLRQEIKNGMADRTKVSSGNGLTPQHREELERIVVRLLEISARCYDPGIQYELMRLADDLVRLINR